MIENASLERSTPLPLPITITPPAKRRGRPPKSPDHPGKWKFKKCRDSRGHAVLGLWERNGRYYYQMFIPGKGPRKIALFGEDMLPVQSVAQAVTAAHELKRNRRQGRLPMPRIAPPFDEYADRYILWMQETEAKSPLTILKEESALRTWRRFLGSLRLNQITRKHINDFVFKRSQEGVCNRTINLDVVALKHLLNFAKDEGWLRYNIPTDDWKELRHKTVKKELIPPDAVDRLCAAALATVERDGKAVPKYINGQMFADYIKLLAYSGSRRMAALKARWELVDWNRRQITFDECKYGKRVVVDFNDALEAHLKDMHARRNPDNPWLFPSPCPGASGHIVAPHKTFDSIRKDAGLPHVTYHLFRHFFISHAVMSGVDLVCVAHWAGHSNTQLISQVYGHLNNAHTQKAGHKMNFQTTPLERPTPAAADLTVPELLELLRQKTCPKEEGRAPETCAQPPASGESLAIAPECGASTQGRA